MKTRLFRWPDIIAPHTDEPLPTLWRRLLWMAGIWTASVVALLLIAMMIRWVLKT